ncbi:SgcJ/EcaC family oxidoreductase [Mesorhizobium sp. ZMM04-5]|uniref:SgcJ/EcaC family oxidoreductase n=1 Tax=Mesorhizobium marinum TaxID=3228790 RepID=A0ABV3R0I4_9HYPH
MTATPTVEALLAEWIAAFNAHDLDRHMALYTEAALLFGSVDELQRGRDAIRAYFGRRPPGVRVRSYPMPEVREVAPAVAVTAGHVDFADGDQPSPYRMTWVLVREGGDWKIAQHHGSPRFGK